MPVTLGTLDTKINRHIEETGQERNKVYLNKFNQELIYPPARTSEGCKEMECLNVEIKRNGTECFNQAP